MGCNGINVAVGLSGGVDSSIAAFLLKEQGYRVTGIAMQIFDDTLPIKESERHACYGPGENEDLAAAASTSKKLGIPFHVLDLKKAYREHVLDYVRREYLSGRTPNPCVVCNQRLKFGFLLEQAKMAGVDFDLFATGHYAQVKKIQGRCVLTKAVDASKDQTYFLYRLTNAQLSRTLFPVGTLTKRQVRDMAEFLGFETAHRTESQDFIAGGDYSLLFNKDEIKAGQIVDEHGNVLGRHRGIIYYTLGQRRGLGIASARPLHVVKIDASNNRIVVSNRQTLFSKGLIAADLNFIAVERFEQPYPVKAKIRQQHKPANAMVIPHEGNKAKILFDEPQMSVTPGQSAVLYTGDAVFGGGIIEQSI